MTQTLKVGSLEAKPGEKVQGFLEVSNNEFKLPVTIINGNQNGKTVAITGGTHGCEYVGIETAIRLANSIKPEEIKGKIIIVSPVNIPAFHARTYRVGPFDGKNLSSCYPGKAIGTVSEQIAYAITTNLHSQADFYLDLHNGDLHETIVPFAMHPTTGEEKIIKESKKAAGFMGVPYIFGSIWTNSIGSAAEIGVPGVIGELGHSGFWSEEEVHKYTTGVKNVLIFQGVLPGEVQDLGPVKYFDEPGWQEMKADHSGCWYPNVKPGKHVKKGEKIGEIRDYFSNVLSECYSNKDGIILLVARSLAINEGDQLVCIV
jgi:predicted deacylase